jgi:hypothetical protein
LCSLSEWVLTLGDFPDADENGIFSHLEPCKPGEDIHSAIGLDDRVFEFEFTPTVGRLSVIGLAGAAVTFGALFSRRSRVRGSGGRFATSLGGGLKPRLCRHIGPGGPQRAHRPFPRSGCASAGGPRRAPSNI